MNILIGANALEEDVRKLQHQKKHSDARITEHPSMREATINYDEPVIASVESQNKSQPIQKAGKNKVKKATNAQQSIPPISKSAEVKETSTNVEASTTNSKGTSEAIILVNGSITTSATTTSSTSSTSTTSSTSSAPVTNWTAAQQAQLERALQTYPPNWKG